MYKHFEKDPKGELTNEQVIKGLENWILHDCTAKEKDLENAIDLIRHLQGTIEESNKKIKGLEKARKNDYENLLEERGEFNKKIDEQKAEIERLTEAGKEAVRNFTRMETLYKIKCKELELANKKVGEIEKWKD